MNVGDRVKIIPINKNQTGKLREGIIILIENPSLRKKWIHVLVGEEELWFWPSELIKI